MDRSHPSNDIDVVCRVGASVCAVPLRHVVVTMRPLPIERLAGFYAGCAMRALDKASAAFRWFWPNGAHAAAILTHDVEGPAGLANAVRIADLEQDLKASADAEARAKVEHLLAVKRKNLPVLEGLAAPQATGV